MEQGLFFDGKEYISSKRASEISKYTKDYVGQLCRSGKLVSKLVGRNWYVDLESLNAHIGDASSRPKDSVQEFFKKDLSPEKESKKTEKSSLFVHHLKQKHAQAVKRDPQLAWREIDRNRAQEKILTDMEVAYEVGGPLFFDDDAPLYPLPVKDRELQKQALHTSAAIEPETIEEKSDTTIFFKANLVPAGEGSKPVPSPLQIRSRSFGRASHAAYSMDSVVPASVRSKPQRYAYKRQARKKKTHAKAYGLALVVVGMALLAGSVFWSLYGQPLTSTSAQVHRALGND